MFSSGHLSCLLPVTLLSPFEFPLDPLVAMCVSILAFSDYSCLCVFLFCIFVFVFQGAKKYLCSMVPSGLLVILASVVLCDVEKGIILYFMSD